MTQKPVSLNWLQNKRQPTHTGVCMWMAFPSAQGTFVSRTEHINTPTLLLLVKYLEHLFWGISDF